MFKILIVNDVAIVNRLLKASLESEGFSVDTALTGKEGIMMAGENKYDIILLDYRLPDINGGEVCKAVKGGENIPKVPVYFISSLDKDTMAEVIKAAGAEGYLDVACEVEELAGKIKALIGN